MSFCTLNSPAVGQRGGAAPGTWALGRGLACSPQARGWSEGAEVEATAKGVCASQKEVGPPLGGRGNRTGLGRGQWLCLTRQRPPPTPPSSHLAIPPHTSVHPPLQPSSPPPVHPSTQEGPLQVKSQPLTTQDADVPPTEPVPVDGRWGPSVLPGGWTGGPGLGRWRGSPLGRRVFPWLQGTPSSEFACILVAPALLRLVLCQCFCHVSIRTLPGSSLAFSVYGSV